MRADSALCSGIFGLHACVQSCVFVCVFSCFTCVHAPGGGNSLCGVLSASTEGDS